MKHIIRISVIVVAIITASCSDKVGKDISMIFATNVVEKISNEELSRSAYVVSWMDKANKWYTAMGDEAAQNSIEDLYFDGREPRISGDTITLLSVNLYWGVQEKNISFVHNNKRLGESGAMWKYINTVSDFEIVVSSTESDDSWTIVKTDDNNNPLFTGVVESPNNGEYIFTGAGKAHYKFTNSPVCAQKFTIVDPVKYFEIGEPYYSNNRFQLAPLSGNFVIELLNKNEQKIEGDDIGVEYSTLGEIYPQTPLTKAFYDEPAFIFEVNAEIVFRGMTGRYNLLSIW